MNAKDSNCASKLCSRKHCARNCSRSFTHCQNLANLLCIVTTGRKQVRILQKFPGFIFVSCIMKENMKVSGSFSFDFYTYKIIMNVSVCLVPTICLFVGESSYLCSCLLSGFLSVVNLFSSKFLPAVRLFIKWKTIC